VLLSYQIILGLRGFAADWSCAKRFRGIKTYFVLIVFFNAASRLKLVIYWPTYTFVIDKFETNIQSVEEILRYPNLDFGAPKVLAAGKNRVSKRFVF